MLTELHSIHGQPVQIAASSDEGAGRQWIQLLTLGTLNTVDGRGPFTVDDPAGIIAASFSGISTDKLPIDYEHAIDKLSPQGLPAPAAGWISKMEARPDGIWGLAEWTPRAAKLIADKEFRFISPVIAYSNAKGNAVRSILRASLTNNPNLTLKSLNAAQKGPFMDEEEFMRELRSALGLNESADYAAILEAAKTSKSANSADPARFVPIEMFQQTVCELNKLRSGVSLDVAEREVAMLMKEGQLMPFMKDWAISLCQSNKAAFDDFMEGAGKPVAAFINDLTSPFSDYSAQRAQDRGTPELTDIHHNLGLSADDVIAFGGKVAK